MQDHRGEEIVPETEYILFRKIGEQGWSGTHEETRPIVPAWGEARVYKGNEIIAMSCAGTARYAERWQANWDVVPLRFADVISEEIDEKRVFDLYEHPLHLEDAKILMENLYSGEAFSRHLKRCILRQRVISKYGFAIPCIEAIDFLVSMNPLVEVGAGSGYWSRLVNGATHSPDAMIATDSLEYVTSLAGQVQWPPVVCVRAAEAVAFYPNRNVFVSWPSYDESWATKMARLIPPKKNLIYIGEREGGCTADDTFFELMKSDFVSVATLEIPQWESIHDRLFVWERKAK